MGDEWRSGFGASGCHRLGLGQVTLVVVRMSLVVVRMSLGTNCLTSARQEPGTTRTIGTLERRDRVRTAGRVEWEETRTTQSRVVVPPEKCRGEM